MKSNLPPLSDQELTMLTLANAGEYLIKCPTTERLAERGYMYAADPVNYTITKEGREALEAVAESEARQQEKVFRSVANRHAEIQGYVQEAAALLVKAAKESAAITGDSEAHALVQWMEQVQAKVKQELLP